MCILFRIIKNLHSEIWSNKICMINDFLTIINVIINWPMNVYHFKLLNDQEPIGFKNLEIREKWEVKVERGYRQQHSFCSNLFYKV